MPRSNPAIALPAPDPQQDPTPKLQVTSGLLRVCPSAVPGCGGASESLEARRDVAGRVLLPRGGEGTVTYRVTVAFSVSAAELEEVVEEHLSHPRSTDVRVELVSGSR